LAKISWYPTAQSALPVGRPLLGPGQALLPPSSGLERGLGITLIWVFDDRQRRRPGIRVRFAAWRQGTDPVGDRPGGCRQASTVGWDRYAGIDGAVIGMRTFGASAPLKALAAEFGFTAHAVVQAARERIAATAAG
jgi:hypothetical protein